MHFIDLDAFQRVCDCKSCLLKFSAAQPVQLCTEGIQHVRVHEIHGLIYHSQGVISSHGEEECHRDMASLQRVDEKGDLRMSFNLELVGFEIFQDGKVAKDWFEVRVWLVVFGLKIQFPGQQTMSVQDLEAFIKWLKGLSKSKGVNTFQTIHEPLFSMEAVTTGETFDIKTLI